MRQGPRARAPFPGDTRFPNGSAVGEHAGALRACGHCGAIPPAEANYCPECGTPHGLEIMDPLAVSARPPDEEKVSVGSRLGTLAGLVVVAGLVALLWLLNPGDDSPKAISSESLSRPTESTPLPTLPTPLESTTTSRAPTTTLSQDEVRSAPLFVNDTPGPVLEEGVTGTIIAFNRRQFFRVDLATGAIEIIEVEHTIDPGPPGRLVVIDGRLVTHSSADQKVIATDLETGDQLEVEMGIPFEEGWSEIAGQAGPESFWVFSTGRVYELYLTGEVGRRIDLPDPFWVATATEDRLYLEGPGGAFEYDTVTGTATQLPGAMGFEPTLQGSRLLVSCDENLDCRVLAETDSGEVTLPGLDATDVWYGGLQVSPDATDALVQRWDDEGPELFHVDLTTGERSSLGSMEVELWSGATWIPESEWVIIHNQDSEWWAVNHGTGELLEIDVPGHTIRPSEFGAVVLLQNLESPDDPVSAG